MDTIATICIFNTETWNARKTFLSPSKYELKQGVHTKLTATNSLFLPTERVVQRTLLPFWDHHATLTITFAIAYPEYKKLAFPFLRTYCEQSDTEDSCLILKYNIHITTPLNRIPFLEFSQKQPPFCSKVFDLTVKKHINIPGRHKRIEKFHLKKITDFPTKTTSKMRIPFF